VYNTACLIITVNTLAVAPEFLIGFLSINLPEKIELLESSHMTKSTGPAGSCV